MLKQTVLKGFKHLYSTKNPFASSARQYLSVIHFVAQKRSISKAPLFLSNRFIQSTITTRFQDGTKLKSFLTT